MFSGTFRQDTPKGNAWVPGSPVEGVRRCSQYVVRAFEVPAGAFDCARVLSNLPIISTCVVMLPTSALHPQLVPMRSLTTATTVMTAFAVGRSVRASPPRGIRIYIPII